MLELQKPFDTKALTEQLKAQGLPMLEKDVEILAKTTFSWAKASVALAAKEQPLYALGIPVLEQVEQLAEKAIDRIDGAEG